MTTNPAYQSTLQFEHRGGKRARISALLEANLYKHFSSAWLHGEFGSSFRSRASEINDDPQSPIVIRNDFFYDAAAGAEISFYWAEPRGRHIDLG